MRKRIHALLMVLLLLSCLPLAASADNRVDMNAKGSITANVFYQKKPLKNLKLTCIRVGELVEKDNELFYASLFSQDLYSTETIHDPRHPEKILKLVKASKAEGITQKTDENGMVRFEDLTPGLYLIYQSAPYSKNGNKYQIQEFFITIPLEGRYDVEAKCKLGLVVKTPTPCSPTPTVRVTRLPQTGQLSWPIPVLACSGMFLFALGWWLCFGRKDPHER